MGFAFCQFKGLLIIESTCATVGKLERDLKQWASKAFHFYW